MQPHHTTPHKRCSLCKQEFPATAEYFYLRGDKSPGLRSTCKPCTVKRNRQTIDVERDKLRAREYAKTHREQAYKAHQKWRDKDPEAFREYSRNQKRRIPNDPEKRKQWEHANRDRIRLYRHRRDALNRSLPNDFTESDWQFALTYFNDCCAACGRRAGLFHTLAMDHFVPISSQDCPGTIPANIIPLCHGAGGCNNSKRSRQPDKWLVNKFGEKQGQAILARIQEFFSLVR